MKPHLITFLALCLGWMASMADTPSPARPAPILSHVYAADVVRVIDGDTVVLDIDLGFGVWVRRHSCRLLNVHAPELFSGNDRAAGQAFKEAFEKLVSAEGHVLIESTKDDKYGRYLVQIWTADGTDVNAELQKLPQGGK